MLKFSAVAASAVIAGAVSAALFLCASVLRAQAPAVNVSSARNLADKYCVTCHNQRLRTAGLMLDRIDFSDAGASAAVLEKVVRKLRAGEMPPSGAPRPDPQSLSAFTSWIEDALDRAAEDTPDPGRVGLHRMNRTEYSNAIRDLLGLEMDAAALLPPDDADEHGFENIAGILSVSPSLLEAYLSAAGRISRLAVGDTSIVPVLETYNVAKTAVQDDRMSEDLPFGSRGGLAVRYPFPVDGEYAVRIHLRRQLYDYIVGLGRPQVVQVRVDGALAGTVTVGGEDHGLPPPATFVGAVPGDADWEEYAHSADRNLEVRFEAKAGTRTVGISFVHETVEAEGPLQPRNSSFGLSSDEMWLGNAAIDNVAIGGPFRVAGPGDSPSRRRIFQCRPSAGEDPDRCARVIIESLARRAYRRPVRTAEISSLLRLFAKGRGFDAGIEAALEAILSDPDFLFRVQEAPANSRPGSVYRLSDIDLASRLSFFLWSSIPDEELLSLAEQGKLGDPVVLEQQVQRMLADDRSRSLVTNFAAQWLELRKIRGVTPDLMQFGEFDDSLRGAFETETELFLEDQIRGDHKVADLIDANYTFVNERLAQFYGIPGAYGSHFRRVFPDNPERKGLLGQASVLTLTSYPNRTSPVLRGKWLLDNVLGSPPPPPPADVPALKDSGSGGNASSVRERMEQHRSNAACAVCHVRMDPLGFSLENFDAIGRWRTSSSGLPIDAKASLPDGTRFEGAQGLRSLLAGRSDLFARTVTEKLLTYALGRELSYGDSAAVRKIVRDAAARGSRWSAIILGVVKSVPFQMSLAPGEGTGNDVRN